MTDPASTDPPQDGPDLLDLLGRLAEVELWLLEMRPTERWGDDPGGDVLRRHLLWLDRLQRDGVLFLSGPVDLDRGWDGTGLSVLRAASREEATALVADEPFGLAGLRRNTLRSWQVNEGSITLTVGLFGGSGRLT